MLKVALMLLLLAGCAHRQEVLDCPTVCQLHDQRVVVAVPTDDGRWCWCAYASGTARVAR